MIVSKISRLINPLLLVLCLAFVSSATAAEDDDDESWSVGTFTDRVTRRSTMDGYDETDFYYPIVDENDAVAAVVSQQRIRGGDDDSTTFPLVVFLGASYVDKGMYSQFSTHLASKGYIVAVPNHIQDSRGGQFSMTGFLPSQWTPTDVWVDVRRRNWNTSSPLFGLVDKDRAAISGHSDGGAAALFATSTTCQSPFCSGSTKFALGEEFKAVAVHGTHTVPHSGRPGQLQVELEPLDVNNTIPVAIINGELDMEHVCATWPLIEEEKDLIIIARVNHWGLTNEQNPIGVTQETDEIQMIPQSTSIALSAEWTAAFFDAYLKQDPDAILLLEEHRYENGVYLNQHCQTTTDDYDDDKSGASSTILSASPHSIGGALLFMWALI
jgi:Chlorophyllase enzyme